jgi:tetratricopeptide (TPR) repeat protein
MNATRNVTLAVVVFLFAGVAMASWYDDYDEGLNAARKGQWPVVIQKMTAALAGNKNENDKSRTYGANFVNYHPYYYRGVAYMNTGKYEQAIADFEKTSGPGEADLGALEVLMQRAKSRLQAANAPEPQPAAPAPTPQPQRPAPVPVPAAPAIDPALRAQANGAIEQAKAHITAAQQRKAGNTPQYAQATQALTNALTQNATAHSNDDLNQVIAIAQNAATIADLAPAPGAPIPAAIPTPAAPRPVAASAAVLADSTRRVRSALESYFRGDFEEASKAFGLLTKDLPRNGWIYAFLGASQYSQYAFEADESYKAAALESFRKAKASGKFRNGLPNRYFSKRIRNVFDGVS